VETAQLLTSLATLFVDHKQLPSIDFSAAMLLSYCARLKRSGARVILASSSPRRKQLMDQLLPAVPFGCIPSTFAENIPHGTLTPAEYATQTSLEKAKEVWAREAADVLISADTVVVRDGVILEKPASPAHAYAMLESLSNRSHQVVSGVTLMFRPQYGASQSAAASASDQPIVITFSVSTSVTFTELQPEMILEYIHTQEPFDKAGGYGMQSLAATFVRGITGDYYNVVGFPLTEIATRLREHLDEVLRALEARSLSSSSAAVKHAWACCFCGAKSAGFVGRNNPEPFPSHRLDCCNPCNDGKVTPARRIQREAQRLKEQAAGSAPAASASSSSATSTVITTASSASSPSHPHAPVRLVTILPCNDLDKCEAFYAQLGFVRDGREYDGYRILKHAEGASLHLTEAVEGSVKDKENQFGMYLYTPDPDALAEKVRSQIIEKEKRPTVKEWGMYEFALTDPNGTLVRIGWPVDQMKNT
jgi:septum formation protein